MSHLDLHAPSDELREALDHLRACPACRFQALAIRRGALPDPAAVFDGIWRRLESRPALGPALSEEPGELHARLAGLLALPPRERAGRIRSDPRCQTYPFAELLIERAHSADGSAAVAIGGLALEVVGCLEGSSSRGLLAQELEAAAHIALAEALRRQGRRKTAAAELLRASQVFSDGLVDAGDTRARLVHTLAAVWRDQGRFIEAIGLFSHAADLWAEVENRGGEAGAWIEVGELALGETFDSPRALAAFDSAAAAVAQAPEEHRREACLALAGRVRVLAFEDFPQEAFATLEEGRRRLGFEEDSVERLELLALEGRLEARRGHTKQARRLLRQAFEGLRQARAHREALAAGVELLRLSAPVKAEREAIPGLLTELEEIAAQPVVDLSLRAAVQWLRHCDSPIELLESLALHLERNRVRPGVEFKWEANRSRSFGALAARGRTEEP